MRANCNPEAVIDNVARAYGKPVRAVAPELAHSGWEMVLRIVAAGTQIVFAFPIAIAKLRGVVDERTACHSRG